MVSPHFERQEHMGVPHRSRWAQTVCASAFGLLVYVVHYSQRLDSARIVSEDRLARGLAEAKNCYSILGTSKTITNFHRTIQPWSMASSPQLTVATAYRELYRAGLRAIQYSTPARYTLRSTIRRAFRNGAPADLDPTKVRRTVLFLQNAAKSRGTEHRVTRNLMIYRWYELEHGKLRLALQAI